MSGLTEWPSLSVVIHDSPTENVELVTRSGRLTAKLVNSVQRDYIGLDGRVVIPLEDFEDAVENRAELSVCLDGAEYGGKLVFLPVSESEPYSSGKAISGNGSLDVVAAGYYTELVAISYVTDIVVSGGFASSNFTVLAAYKSNGEFVRTLLPGGRDYVNVHVVPDNSYDMIRASSSGTRPKSLILIYG